jgi:hypothetical protein
MCIKYRIDSIILIEHEMWAIVNGKITDAI